MAEKTRLIMQRSTSGPYTHHGCQHIGVRRLLASDNNRLGQLIYDAYKETVDDEGGSLKDATDEASQTLDGKYGSVLWNASWAIQADDGAIISACVVTDYSKLPPLLAFCLTNPHNQGKGLASCLIERTLVSLHESGIQTLHLVVTSTNTQALRLYKRLGFVERSTA